MGVEFFKGGDRNAPRLCFMGGPGVGKSTLASKFPNPIVVPTEDGMSAMPIDQFKVVTSWEGLIECIDYVGVNDTGHETFIIDTIDGAENLLIKYVTQKYFDGHFEATKGRESFMSYGKGYKVCAQEIQKLLTRLDALRNKKNMNVILIAHTQIVTEKNPLGNDWGKIAAAMHKDAWGKVLSWCDLVGYISTPAKVLGAEKFSDVGKIKAVGNTRTIIWEGHPGLDVKCRAGYEMPSEMALDYDELAAHLWAKPADKLKDLKDECRELLSQVDDETATKAKKYLGKTPSADKLKTTINRLLIALEGAQEKKDATTV